MEWVVDHTSFPAEPVVLGRRGIRRSCGSSTSWVASQPGHTPVAAKTRSRSNAVNGFLPRSTFSSAARLIFIRADI